MIQSLWGKTFRRTVAVVAGAAMLSMTWPLMVWGQAKTDEQPKPADHAKHVTPGDPATKADDALADQVQQLRAKVAKLEAALSRGQGAGQSSPMSRGHGMGTGASARSKGMNQNARVSVKYQDCLQCHQTRPSGPLPQSHLEKAGDIDTGTVGGGSKPGGGMAKSGGGGKPMMDDDGDEMGAMGGGGGGMGMKDEMGMGSMGGKSGGGMAKSGGGGMSMMDDDSGEMGMMGMGAMGKAKSMAGMAVPSALPGFPGASHLYHIGATGFFMNHGKHITLSAAQKTSLNKIKQKALLAGSTARRKIDEAEQELWALSGADEPKAEVIEAKVKAIEEIRSTQRLAFIRLVGEAAKVLTDDQRAALIGTAADAPDEPAPAAKP